MKGRSQRTLEKAARLVAEGAVLEVPAARAFWVKGSTGVYLVTIVVEQPAHYTGLVPPRATCTCTWGRSGNEGDCSHILAVRAIIREQSRPADPFEGFPTEGARHA